MKTTILLTALTLSLAVLAGPETTASSSGKIIYHQYNEPIGVLVFTMDGDAAKTIFDLMGRAPKMFESTTRTTIPSGDFAVPGVKRMLMLDNWLAFANDTLICEKSLNKFTCTHEVLVKFEKKSSLKKPFDISDLAKLDPTETKQYKYKQGEVRFSENNDRDLYWFRLTYSGSAAEAMFELVSSYPDSEKTENSVSSVTGDFNCKRDENGYSCSTGPIRLDVAPLK